MRRREINPGAAIRPAIVFLAMALGVGQAHCADAPVSNALLLNLFVQKGYVSQAEADAIKAEAEQQQAQMEQYKATADQLKTETEQLKQQLATLKSESQLYETNVDDLVTASKWKMLTGTKSFQLYGDARARFEARTAQDPGGNTINLDRYRYAVHFGLLDNMDSGVYYGLRLESASNPRSPFITMGTYSSSTYPGPFGKSNAAFDIGQVYLGFKPADWLDVTVGKIPNPLYTTTMLWSQAINPEGASEKLRYTVGDADLFANFGQFLYGDLNPNQANPGLGINGLVGQNTANVFMFAWQGGMKYHISDNISAKIGATIYNYAGLRRSTLNSGTAYSPYLGDPYVGEGAYYWAGGSGLGYAPGYSGYGTSNFAGQGGYGSQNYPFNQVGLDNLLVLEIPFEANFKTGRFAERIFGDVAYNLEGAQRAQEASSAYSYVLSQAPPNQALPHSFLPQTQDVHAYQFGVGIGSTNFVAGPMQGVVYGTANARNAWELRTYWQHIEQYSLDPNLLDTDFFNGLENMEGFYVAFAYNYSPNLSFTIRYGNGHRINNLLGTGGSSQDIPQINPVSNFSIVQLDIGLMF